MTDHEPQTTTPGWRVAPVTLTILVSDSGLVSLCADKPRNLSVTGHSLREAFNAFIIFAEDCEHLGKPFESLDGIKL